MNNKSKAEFNLHKAIESALAIKSNAEYILENLDDDIIDKQEKDISELQSCVSDLHEVSCWLKAVAKYWGDNAYLEMSEEEMKRNFDTVAQRIMNHPDCELDGNEYRLGCLTYNENGKDSSIECYQDRVSDVVRYCFTEDDFLLDEFRSYCQFKYLNYLLDGLEEIYN